MPQITFLGAIILASAIAFLLIGIVYYFGTKTNRNIVNGLKTQLFLAVKEFIMDFTGTKTGSALWTFVTNPQSGFPMKIFNIVISLTRRHFVLSLLGSKFWGTSDLIIFEGDFKRRARMNFEIVHRREKQVQEKYRRYFQSLEWVDVPNPDLTDSFIMKSNNFEQAKATLRFKDLQQTLLDTDSFFYWASIETESPQLRIAFHLNSSFSVTEAVNMTKLLIQRYDQVLRKAETRRS